MSQGPLAIRPLVTGDSTPQFHLPSPRTPRLGHALAVIQRSLSTALVVHFSDRGGFGQPGPALPVAGETHAAFGDAVDFISLSAISVPTLIIPTNGPALGRAELSNATIAVDYINIFGKQKICVRARMWPTALVYRKHFM